MKDFTQWSNSAAEEAVEQLLKSSMDICSKIRKDLEDRKSIDHEKLESLQYSWKTLRESILPSKDNNESNAVEKNTDTLKDILLPEDKFSRKLPTIDDYITSPVTKYNK